MEKGMFAAAPREVVSAGDPFGVHRTLHPKGALPQPADRLDNDFSRIFRGEMLVEVETLNVDAASFRQMEEAGDVAARVLETVSARGKQHNPVTGSGGMLLGRVVGLAPGRPDGDAATIGDRVATLVSLSLTPLRIDRIKEVRPRSAQIDVDGEAVIFASGPYAVIPPDLPERVVLAALDVAGAAPQAERLVARAGPDATVVVLGAGGKSGILVALAARRAGAKTVVGVETHPPYLRDLGALRAYEAVVAVDARDPLATRDAVLQVTKGREADVVFSCVNVEGVELAAVLCARPRGVVYFFAMSTSFSRAALGAEGLGRDVDLMIGNGFAEGHADATLALLRDNAVLRDVFGLRYG